MIFALARRSYAVEGSLHCANYSRRGKAFSCPMGARGEFPEATSAGMKDMDPSTPQHVSERKHAASLRMTT